MDDSNDSSQDKQGRNATLPAYEFKINGVSDDLEVIDLSSSIGEEDSWYVFLPAKLHQLPIQCFCLLLVHILKWLICNRKYFDRLFTSPKSSSEKKISPYKWMRQDLEKNNPEVENTRKSLVFRLDDATRSMIVALCIWHLKLLWYLRNYKIFTLNPHGYANLFFVVAKTHRENLRGSRTYQDSSPLAKSDNNVQSETPRQRTNLSARGMHFVCADVLLCFRFDFCLTCVENFACAEVFLQLWSFKILVVVVCFYWCDYFLCSHCVNNLHI